MYIRKVRLKSTLEEILHDSHHVGIHSQVERYLDPMALIISRHETILGEDIVHRRLAKLTSGNKS